ncbi:type IX secretion system sortase PorU [Winogradskyella immobilis]|uniref:Type IX secretion system sortase PorU n=1 Tax=Winogradskyella immobilis TaxID=2816852 RepID=A0ABS8ENQ8_9FLAO|nr:type IX secretion system sortase PorU [Winogradskyella immobilis]MCC1484755.1 type IX secretion system sortase PorU [Winogradskyella immobilis]MCG0016847.1 type IX secretion system sortase PorU [Winogradskyella immobilis]
MKKSFTLTLFLIYLFSFSQQKQYVINWEGVRVLESDYSKIEIPSFNSNHFSYNDETGLTYFAQWDNNNIINENSVRLTNVSYAQITIAELKDLKPELIPSELRYTLKNTKARDKRSAYFELTPIINDNGVYKKVTAFTVNYNFGANNRSSNSAFLNRTPFNSVLESGDWYRFTVDTTGVFQLTRNFLNQLGVNTNAVDPRTIKIFGNGGRMLPLPNSVDYPIDLTENAIQFVGEEDGSFDSNDFILFYAQGPTGFTQESNTNLNLYSDESFYYVNVSSGNGKRIAPLIQPEGEPTLIIDNFQANQFYEVDEFNLVRLGRRWFGDSFNVENQRSYTFNFPNIDTSEPARFTITFGSIAETSTSMAVSINGNNVSNISFPIVDLEGTVIASGGQYVGNVNLTSDEIGINLDYENNGNPTTIAHLDYINIEATRRLEYVDEQLLFTNRNVAINSGIAQYNLTNTSSVSQIWDITDRFNVTSFSNSDQNSEINLKAIAGEERTYIAFSNSDFFEPRRTSNSQVANQNLKGTIFLNDDGVFEDIDYIIITPEFLLGQAERLAEINRNQNNLNVKVVMLNEIYNEFSSGNQDIAGIRNFVRYVYDNASEDSRRLKYLGLFGDASYDYKDRIRNNTNIVPSWFSVNSFSLTSSFISDDFYGVLDVNEGTLATSDRLDVAVGRLLADDLQRAKDIVDKIERYYAEESFGNWRNNLLVVSDDVDEPFERVLQQTTDDLATEAAIEKPFFNTIKVHSDAFQQQSSSGGDRYPDANAAIRDAIEVGALVVNYFGHGGEDGLADERIFITNDAQEVNNFCRFNCFVTVTCEYTRYDDPNRATAGEFTYWNTRGGAVALITTTRQIFVTVGTDYNEVLDDYLFAFGSNEVPTMAEALRLTKLDPQIAGSFQNRLVHFIGDPAMKLAIPQPNIRLTAINDVPVGQDTDVLQSLSRIKLSGEVTDENGNVLSDYNGVLTATVYDKEIQRQTLANDGVTDSNGLIRLDFTTLGETIFNGQATINNGVFEFNFVVPRDIGIPVGQGKVSFYAKNNARLEDQTGYSFDIQVGGINENAEEDNVGPVVNLFMNDENFVSGGITNESPTLLARLQDANGINTASGIGHDISAILDGDETNPFILNDYYQANVDDFTNGVVSFPFRDLEPGLHTITLTAWDVYNNSSESEIQFLVFDNNEELVINNVLNYPNPFVDYTEFWFNHNSSDVLDISVQIFTVSGKLVKTINGQTNQSGKSTSTLSRDIVWDGRDDFGDKIGKGVYVYKLKVKSQRLNKQIENIQKLVIL